MQEFGTSCAAPSDIIRCSATTDFRDGPHHIIHDSVSHGTHIDAHGRQLQHLRTPDALVEPPRTRQGGHFCTGTPSQPPDEVTQVLTEGMASDLGDQRYECAPCRVLGRAFGSSSPLPQDSQNEVCQAHLSSPSSPRSEILSTLTPKTLP